MSHRTKTQLLIELYAQLLIVAFRYEKPMVV